jgi:hypothetical protein
MGFGGFETRNPDVSIGSFFSEISLSGLIAVLIRFDTNFALSIETVCCNWKGSGYFQQAIPRMFIESLPGSSGCSCLNRRVIYFRTSIMYEPDENLIFRRGSFLGWFFVNASRHCY